MFAKTWVVSPHLHFEFVFTNLDIVDSILALALVINNVIHLRLDLGIHSDTRSRNESFTSSSIAEPNN